MTEAHVVFENAHFVAVDKPAGWLTVPGRTNEADARVCLGRELEKKFGRLWPIHRLDADVTGLVLFARDATAHRTASMWFEKRTVHKLYRALTEIPAAGVPSFALGQEFIWKSVILRGKKRAYESPHGKEAVTRAVYRGPSGAGLAWELEPLTGRSHQLRFELVKQGFVIVGDKLYGAKTDHAGGGIALRSVELSFVGIAEAPGLGLPERLALSEVVS